MTAMAAAEIHNHAPVELVLERVRAAGKKVRQSRPDQWEAQCPAHDDNRPSMGINETPAGKVLVSCRAGCTAPQIVAALGLKMADLFPPGPGRTGPQERAVYKYTDEDGEVLFEVVRGIDANGRKTFHQRHFNGTTWVNNIRGVRRVPYMLPQVLKARREDRKVYITEGEKDAENLQWHIDGAATCNPMGAGAWRPEYNEHFAGCDVVVIADDDTPGRGHADVVATNLGGVARSVRVVLPAAGCKDATDHLKAGHTIDDFRPIEGAEEVPEIEPTDSEWDPSSSLVETAKQIRSGERQKLMPDTLAVAGAAPLLYPGRTNSIFGESGGGKSWLELWAVVEAVRAGHRVALIDYEDSEDGIAERLVMLGATDEEIGRVDYYNPTTGLSLGIADFEQRGTEYRHVWIDSSGEAMAAAGVDPNSDPEVARWFTVVRRFTRLPGGPGSTVLDHIPKATDAPAAYAIGSQRKRAAVTGASYRVETITEPAKGKNGKLKLIVAKDRGGNRAKGSVAAIVDILANEDGTLRLELRAPNVDDDGKNGERLRPFDVMQRVSEFVEQVGAANMNTIQKNVTGNANKVKDAVTILRNEGYLAVEPKGQSVIHRVAKPYRKLADPFVAPVDKSPHGLPVPPIPTDSNRFPDSAGNRFPDSHPPKGGIGTGTGSAGQTTFDRFPVDNSGTGAMS